MANNKNPNHKQPGEKEPGTFHFNPGNMSGKTEGTPKLDEAGEVSRQQDKNKNKEADDT